MTMSDQEDGKSEDKKIKSEERGMLIFTIVVVLIIAAGAGLNKIYHTPSDTQLELSSSNRGAAPSGR